MSRTSSLLVELKKNIDLLASFGIKSYPKSEALRSFLESSPKEHSAPVPTRKATQKKSKPNDLAKELKKVKTLTEVKTELGDCIRCSLHQGRSRILFGYGNPDADLFIISEWPNEEDNAEGRLFSGDDGELLNKMLIAIGLDISEVYITALVKCKATEENPPDHTQLQACLPFLLSQLDAVKPKVICTMGPLACQTILKKQTPLLRLRGSFHNYKSFEVMPTFHPSYLLKNPEMKKATWVDLQMIQKKLAIRNK